MSAEFHMNAELTMLPSKHALNIKNLKDLYGFRIYLKQGMAELE